MKLIQPVFLALAGLLLSLGLLTPTAQDPGVQGAVWTSQTITTTATTKVVACSQGSGHVGRKTLVVHSGSGSDDIVTVTAQLRDTQAGPNFTSAYLAVNAVAVGASSSDTTTPDEAGGAFCQVSATAATTAVVTVTLRRE